MASIDPIKLKEAVNHLQKGTMSLENASAKYDIPLFVLAQYMPKNNLDNYLNWSYLCTNNNSPQKTTKTKSSKLPVLPFTEAYVLADKDPYSIENTYDVEGKRDNYVARNKHLIAKNLYVNADGKIDLSQFSHESLKHRYSDESKYFVSDNSVYKIAADGDLENYINVYESDHHFRYREYEYSDNGEITEKVYKISKDGELLSVETSVNNETVNYREYKNNILQVEGKDFLNSDFIAYNNLKKELSLGYISQSNIAKIKTDIYKRVDESNILGTFQGFDIISAIKQSKALPEEEKRKMISYISNLLYDNNLTLENQRISNSFYTSDKMYDVTFSDDKIVIAESGKSYTRRTIYLDRLLYQDNNEFEKLRLKSLLQQMPAEALYSFAYEVECLKIQYTNITKGERGHYHFTSDAKNGEDEEVSVIQNLETILHELGHAIDYSYNNAEGINKSKAENSKEFKRAFQDGMTRYKEAGFTQYSYDEGYKSVEDIQYDNLSLEERVKTKPKSNYCTANIREMMAECYSLLMSGDCSSKDVIVTYFPECLEYVKEIIKQTEELPRNDRKKL